MTSKTVLVLSVAAVVGVSVLSVPPDASAEVETPRLGSAVAGPDFDADGFADLAMSAPSEDALGLPWGAVHIIPGSPDGPDSTRQQTFSPPTEGLAGDGIGATFGEDLAWGDFDGDTYDDLAIGWPDATWGDLSQAGAVQVLYGGPSGLAVDGNQFWTLDSAGLEGDPRAYQRFGAGLCVGDFNGDGAADLALTLLESFETSSPLIRLIYGSPDGLTGTGSVRVLPGFQTVLHMMTMAAGDFDGDGDDALAVGLPHGESGGRVAIHDGASEGISTRPSEVWTQDSAGVRGDTMPYERFGNGVGTGDVNGDGLADLAIVVGRDQHPRRRGTGFHLLLGSADGLTARGDQLVRLRKIRGPITSRVARARLTLGDVDADGYADLFTGMSPADVLVGGSTVDSAGAVLLVPGGAGGLVPARSQVWTQDSARIADQPEENDQFGFGFGVGDYDGDGHADGAIGVPFELIAGEKAGAVHVLRGAGDGFTSLRSQFWYLGSEQLPGDPDYAFLGWAIG